MQPLTVIAAVLAAVAAMGCLPTRVAAQTCAAYQPQVTVAVSALDALNVANGPVALRVAVITADAVPISISVTFGLRRDGVYYARQFTMTQFRPLGDPGFYEVYRLMTPIDPPGIYDFLSLTFVDETGASVTTTSPSGLSSFTLTGTYPALNPDQPPPPELRLWSFSNSSVIDVTTGPQTFAFLYTIDIFTGTQLGALSVQYTCPSPARTYTFTASASSATMSSANASYPFYTRWTGAIPVTFYPGTTACAYQVSSGSTIADSSYQSTAYPSPIGIGYNSLFYNQQSGTFNIRSNSDTGAPVLDSVTVNTLAVNTTNGPTSFTLTFRAHDVGGSGATSGISSISFSGKFPATPVVLTSANAVGSSGNANSVTYTYTIAIPQGFPADTWVFMSPITVTDRALNSAQMSSSLAVTISCGAPVVAATVDARDLSDSSLNGVIAFMFIFLFGAVIICLYLVRRQRHKYEFDPNADIPAVPTKPDYQAEVEVGADASVHAQPPSGAGAGASNGDVSSFRPEVVTPAAPRGDAVAEMAAARAEMEAQRARDEAAHTPAAGGVEMAPVGGGGGGGAAEHETSPPPSASVTVDVAPEHAPAADASAASADAPTAEHDTHGAADGAAPSSAAATTPTGSATGSDAGAKPNTEALHNDGAAAPAAAVTASTPDLL